MWEFLGRKNISSSGSKKPGGAGKKLYQVIKAVNQGCSVTLPFTPGGAKVEKTKYLLYNKIKQSKSKKLIFCLSSGNADIFKPAKE